MDDYSQVLQAIGVLRRGITDKEHRISELKVLKRRGFQVDAELDMVKNQLSQYKELLSHASPLLDSLVKEVPEIPSYEEFSHTETPEDPLHTEKTEYLKSIFKGGMRTPPRRPAPHHGRAPERPAPYVPPAYNPKPTAKDLRYREIHGSLPKSYYDKIEAVRGLLEMPIRRMYNPAILGRIDFDKEGDGKPQSKVRDIMPPVKPVDTGPTFTGIMNTKSGKTFKPSKPAPKREFFNEDIYRYTHGMPMVPRPRFRSGAQEGDFGFVPDKTGGKKPKLTHLGKDVKPQSVLKPRRSQPIADEKKLKFVKRYLKGQGIRATKGNVEKCMCHMEAEGVVFDD